MPWVVNPEHEQTGIWIFNLYKFQGQVASQSAVIVLLHYAAIQTILRSDYGCFLTEENEIKMKTKK